MKSTPKKQSTSTHAAGNRGKVDLKDLKPKKDPRGGIDRNIDRLDKVIDRLDPP